MNNLKDIPFKVGQWVEFEDTVDDFGGSKTFIEKITDIDIDHETFSSANQIFFVNFDNVKPWKPAVGSYVFSEMMVKDPKTYEKSYHVVLSKVVEVTSETSVLLENDRSVCIQDIQPFSGNLPYEFD